MMMIIIIGEEQRQAQVHLAAHARIWDESAMDGKV